MLVPFAGTRLLQAFEQALRVRWHAQQGGKGDSALHEGADVRLQRVVRPLRVVE